MILELVQTHWSGYLWGAWVTFQLVGLALFIGFFLSLPLAVAGNSDNPLLHWPVRAFVFVFRGTPLLAQLYILYYGAGQFTEELQAIGLWKLEILEFRPGDREFQFNYGTIGFSQAWFCCLIAFVLNTAAYTTEIFRGSMAATPFGEVEAAKACGMSTYKTYRRIIIPGALRRAIPAYGNEVIFMLHGSAVASIVTVADLTGIARLVYSIYYAPFEAFGIVAAIYLCLTFSIVWVFKRVEAKYLKHLREREA